MKTRRMTKEDYRTCLQAIECELMRYEREGWQDWLSYAAMLDTAAVLNAKLDND